MKQAFFAASFAAVLLALTAGVAPCCCWFNSADAAMHACCTPQADNSAAPSQVSVQHQHCHCQLDAGARHTAPEMLAAPQTTIDLALPGNLIAPHSGAMPAAEFTPARGTPAAPALPLYLRCSRLLI